MKTTSLILLVLKAALAAAFYFFLLPSCSVRKKKSRQARKHAYKAEKAKNHEFCSGDNWSNGDKVSFRRIFAR